MQHLWRCKHQVVKGEPMSNKDSLDGVPATDSAPKSDDNSVTIRRGRVSSVDLYEIKESELDQLENGSDAGIKLNFSIFLFSMAATAIASLCTADFSQSPTVKTIFLIVSIVGIVIGLYLLIVWVHEHKSTKTVIKKIRERIPQSGNAKTEAGCDTGEAPRSE